MLVLMRRANEQVLINDQIVVTVIETSKGQVRLGFSAPADCRIYRREIMASIPPAVLSDPSQTVVRGNSMPRELC